MLKDRTVELVLYVFDESNCQHRVAEVRQCATSDAAKQHRRLRGDWLSGHVSDRAGNVLTDFHAFHTH